MGPTIILDKSSLQALSKKELVLLNKLYFVNIPPILPIEILADLKKGGDPEAFNEETVIIIANKLIQRDNAFNVHYMNVVISALLGIDYSEERRTLVRATTKVKDRDGKIGYPLVETKEQTAVRNWQKGNFNEADKVLADKWRAYTKEIDLKSLREEWSPIKKIHPECKDSHTLFYIVDHYLNHIVPQKQF